MRFHKVIRSTRVGVITFINRYFLYMYEIEILLGSEMLCSFFFFSEWAYDPSIRRPQSQCSVRSLAKVTWHWRILNMLIINSTKYYILVLIILYYPPLRSALKWYRPDVQLPPGIFQVLYHEPHAIMLFQYLLYQSFELLANVQRSRTLNVLPVKIEIGGYIDELIL